MDYHYMDQYTVQAPHPEITAQRQLPDFLRNPVRKRAVVNGGNEMG